MSPHNDFCAQAFTADTFALGLAALHLLIGPEPYEEALAAVRCPAYLRAVLRSHWETDDTDSPYFVVGEVLRSLTHITATATAAAAAADDSMAGDSEEDDPGHGHGTWKDTGHPTTSIADVGLHPPAAPCDALYDTFYRYLVLFAPAEGARTGAGGLDDARAAFCGVYAGIPLWGAALHAVGIHAISSSAAAYPDVPGINADVHTLRDACVRQYTADHGQWAWHTGTHPVINHARARLHALGGEAAYRLFDRLVHFDPARRCTMHEALLSPVFACYRQHPHQHPSAGVGAGAGAGAGAGVAYMHYYRPRALTSAAAGGASSLPML